MSNQDNTFKGWIAGVLSTVISGVVVYYLTEGRNTKDNENSEPQDPPVIQTVTPTPPIQTLPPSPPVQTLRRLHFSWQPAPAETQQILSEIRLRGDVESLINLYNLTAKGLDLFIIKANLSNTGNIALQLDPQNINIYYRNHSTSVQNITDDRFLQPTTLSPDQNLERLIAFIGPIDLQTYDEVKIGYFDDSIEVKY